MKYLAIALASAALTGAQTPGISIRPGNLAVTAHEAGSPASFSRLAAPVLGYVNGPGSLDLRIILSTPKGAQIGGALALPANVKRFFLPPREHYLLIESKSPADPLAIWQPMNENAAPVPLPALPPHPDRVAFSSRGDAAVVYSKASDRLQIVTGLPAEPVLTAQLAIAKWGEPVSLTVSDDGEWVVAFFADGSALLSSHAGDWRRLPAVYGAGASLFISRTHNLVFSDPAQQTLSLVSNVGESGQSVRILTHNTAADRLAITKEGAVLLAASTSSNKAWTVDLRTLTAASVAPSPIDTLVPLRDGHTFLLSAPGLRLLNVSLESDNVAAFLPVTH
jgi:hypothetical protein